MPAGRKGGTPSPHREQYVWDCWIRGQRQKDKGLQASLPTAQVRKVTVTFFPTSTAIPLTGIRYDQRSDRTGYTDSMLRERGRYIGKILNFSAPIAYFDRFVEY
ncbi:MAG: hypothetical protein A2Z25_05395 [Planctomycetes bacterium RBG_16_55_9]|nr:MAG: hypothetical protein A2Z25_05395 [Planctomycetes bacterium RBG_16_55_9]